MKCRGKTILRKPLDRIKITFPAAQGPVLTNLVKEVQSGIQNTENQRKEYGSQRNPPNNDAAINEAPANIKEKLQ